MVGILAALLLVACSRHEPVREIPPVNTDDAQLQIYPLQNPGTRVLREEAVARREAGDLKGAGRIMAAALELAPRDPLLLQDMAELQLLRGDYRDAERLARESWMLGPRVGPLCERNWNTVALAAPRLGDQQGAREAAERLPQCALPPVPHVDDQRP